MKTIILLLTMLHCQFAFCQIPKLGTQTPVEFSGLSTIHNDGLSLIWTTESEKDNDHFEIQRSSDNGLTWSNVGEVKGHGTTKSKQYYQWNETEQLHCEVYYRLIQVDFDGKRTDLTIVYYDFTDSYYNGIKLNGKILSIRKVQEQGSSNLVIIVTDRQVYKIMSTYQE